MGTDLVAAEFREELAAEPRVASAAFLWSPATCGPRETGTRLLGRAASIWSKFTKDSAFALEAFKNMLKLWAELEGPGRTSLPPERYYDLSYYERSLF